MQTENIHHTLILRLIVQESNKWKKLLLTALRKESFRHFSNHDLLQSVLRLCVGARKITHQAARPRCTLHCWSKHGLRWMLYEKHWCQTRSSHVLCDTLRDYALLDMAGSSTWLSCPTWKLWFVGIIIAWMCTAWKAGSSKGSQTNASWENIGIMRISALNPLCTLVHRNTDQSSGLDSSRTRHPGRCIPKINLLTGNLQLSTANFQC